MRFIYFWIWIRVSKSLEMESLWTAGSCIWWLCLSDSPDEITLSLV
jgi:hypothetical protein